MGILSFSILSRADEDNENGLIFSANNASKSSLNFGLVIENDTYTLYRSMQMNKDKLEELYEHLEENQLPYPKTVIYMNKQGYGGYADFFSESAIEEYEESFKYGYEFFHPYRYDYRTYLSGHSPYTPDGDIDQKKYFGKHALKYFGLKQDGKADGDIEAFIRIMEIVLDPTKQPVLFHCYGGRHRTGMVALMIRYIQGGEWINGPKVKMSLGGTKYFFNPAEYEYYLHNKIMMRKENIDFVRTFAAKEPIFKYWQQKYQEKLNDKR
jgi:hypothetical protein